MSERKERPQTRQVAEPSSLVVPTGHDSHATAAELLRFPAGHGEQSASGDAEEAPAEHG